MPSERDIRARNEKFAKKARETQNVRGAGGAARGLVHKSQEAKRDEQSPSYVRYLALFCLLVLAGGLILELIYVLFRAL
ncbi:uncharacterized protein MJAP1_002517 [Malassezia japonica]|uniref:Stress-associated endoplasmic reticulum protein n=1 Tax=Malassezia japonica TaxID=223818 RepID=A0AAF0JAK7_9BASI|nr:uncharacterized protein MJAP1_002517 [Malassezia japonica]WFD39538.1 hypothetical protein MJAP1_002517 [Malassezia japonica]